MKQLHSATAHGPLIAEKERATRSREDTESLIERAAQSIVAATNDLMDATLRAESLNELLQIARVVRQLGERLNAIGNRASMRGDRT